ncbi:hypothetical protein WJX79_006541 [Trebouxia sp. C0005]
MPEVSLATWTGVASCALSCGCFVVSLANDEKAKQVQSAKAVTHLSDLKELLPLLPLLVAVTGKAYTDSPLNCELSKQKAVITRIKETEHSSLKNSQGTWESHAKVVRHHSSETDWALKDGRSPPLRVLGGVNADELPMTTVGDVYVAADSGRDTTGVSGLVLRSMDTLQGYKVLGHHKDEKALPVGTRLTAIGEIVNTNPADPRDPHNLAIQRPTDGGPFVISKLPLKDIIKSYCSDSVAFREAAIAFGGIGLAIFSTKLLMFGWSNWRDMRIRQRREEASRRRAAQREQHAAAGRENGDAAHANGSGNADHDNDDETETTSALLISTGVPSVEPGPEPSECIMLD